MRNEKSVSTMTDDLPEFENRIVNLYGIHRFGFAKVQFLYICNALLCPLPPGLNLQLFTICKSTCATSFVNFVALDRLYDLQWWLKSKPQNRLHFFSYI
jgi:hypothetical protein